MAILEDLNEVVGAALSGRPDPDVVIVYEDFSTGLAAKQLFTQLFERIEPREHKHFNLWEFSALRLVAARARAVAEAATAAIVCISSRGDRELPVGVKQWADQLACEKAVHPCAVVDLIEVDTKTIPMEVSSREFLRRLADLRGAEFFAGCIGPTFEQPGSWNPVHRLCTL